MTEMDNKESLCEVYLIGKIGERTITEHIKYYSPSIPEELETAKQNIKNKFKSMGYNPYDVEFEEKLKN